MSLGDLNFEIFLSLFHMSLVEYRIALFDVNAINILLSPVHIRLLSHELITVYIDQLL
jgi:hypothetical protein